MPLREKTGANLRVARLPDAQGSRRSIRDFEAIPLPLCAGGLVKPVRHRRAPRGPPQAHRLERADDARADGTSARGLM
jgi:hypothetical protein